MNTKTTNYERSMTHLENTDALCAELSDFRRSNGLTGYSVLTKDNIQEYRKFHRRGGKALRMSLWFFAEAMRNDGKSAVIFAQDGAAAVKMVE